MSPGISSHGPHWNGGGAGACACPAMVGGAWSMVRSSARSIGTTASNQRRTVAPPRKAVARYESYWAAMSREVYINRSVAAAWGPKIFGRLRYATGAMYRRLSHRAWPTFPLAEIVRSAALPLRCSSSARSRAFWRCSPARFSASMLTSSLTCPTAGRTCRTRPKPLIKYSCSNLQNSSPGGVPLNRAWIASCVIHWPGAVVSTYQYKDVPLVIVKVCYTAPYGPVVLLGNCVFVESFVAFCTSG